MPRDDGDLPADDPEPDRARSENETPDADSSGPGATDPDEDDGATAANPQASGTQATDVAVQDDDRAVSRNAFHEAVQAEGRPVVTAAQVARRVGCTQAAAATSLAELAEAGVVERVETGAETVWYPADWAALADSERIVVFPERREIVADSPSQFTRARLSQFAHLTDTTRAGGYRYEIRPADVWQAPYDRLEDLLGTVRDVLPRDVPDLAGWIEDQWRRANRFVLRTHEEGYVVLEAESESLMGNVARQELDDDELRAPISETESWVDADRVADVKRTLYAAGYPVEDRRDLDAGADLDVDLRVELRDYQREWIDRFLDQQAGVFVGPPGSGKTVAAIGVLAAVGGETLILVPNRELAGQWRSELLDRTSLDPDQVGEYHGGAKERRPVTVATYHTAGMDRHRGLFDDREWGLVVLDEAHHVPAPIFRRAADLQSTHRLGLSATPIREADDEVEIYTLIGPPIGTDWSALFDAGVVHDPEVEIQYVPWASEIAHNEYVAADGHEARQVAATNPAKRTVVRRLLAAHPDEAALVFVDYLDQGRAIASAIDAPFVSGETPHHERDRLFDQFRAGDLDRLVVSRVGDEGLDLPNADVAVIASGLGGSRRQGTQRAGRTMRPSGSAQVYVLATQGTEEERFARRRTDYLAGKGVQVRERHVAVEADPDDPTAGTTADPADKDGASEPPDGEQ